MPSEVLVTFSSPAPLLNLNDRLHWRKKAERAAAWRNAAKVAAVQLGPPSKRRRPPASVRVSFPVASLNVRRDPHNFVPTVKPIIDGLVDAGVWPDDHGQWVESLDPRFHVVDGPKGRFRTPGLVVVTLLPKLDE